MGMFPFGYLASRTAHRLQQEKLEPSHRAVSESITGPRLSGLPPEAPRLYPREAGDRLWAS